MYFVRQQVIFVNYLLNYTYIRKLKKFRSTNTIYWPVSAQNDYRKSNLFLTGSAFVSLFQGLQDLLVGNVEFIIIKRRF